MGRERLADARDVAVSEDREHAVEERLVAARTADLLGGEMPHQGLGHRQADRFHGGSSVQVAWSALRARRASTRRDR